MFGSNTWMLGLLCASLYRDSAPSTPSSQPPGTASQPPHPNGNDLVAQVLATQSYRLGDGAVTIEPLADLIRLPASHEELIIDYHAVARDSLGRIYVLYNSLKRSESTRALARFDYVYDEARDQGRFEFDKFLGTRALAEGTVHGMNLLSQPSGILSDSEEKILVVNEDRTITLMDLEGHICWQRQHPSTEGPGRPTTGMEMRTGEFLGIVDGYATSSNFLFRVANGEIVGSTGGRGSADGQSKLNHGVDVDPDGDLVISDRENTRLTWWTGDSFEPIRTEGSHKILNMPGLEVCNVSFIGRFAAVPCLNSTVAFLGPDQNHPSGYRIISVARMPEELIDAGIDGIHDAVFTADGRYLIVAVWERNREQRAAFLR